MRHKKKVVVLGKGTLAIRVADWFHQSDSYQLSAIVPVIPEPSWTESFVNWAKAKGGIDIVESGNYSDIENVKENSWKIDLAFSVFYDKIIKEWFIKKCKRILNLHNAPLPFYRGVSPINWALKNNEKEHGVTIHEITPGVDDGPIISQVKYSIYPDIDEVIDVYSRALEYGWVLFQQTMPMLDKITPISQGHTIATYYSAKKNDLLAERRGFRRKFTKT